MNLNKIPRHVLKDIRRYLSAETGDSAEHDHLIEGMSARRAFACYCDWNGIQGQSDTLMRAIDALRGAEEETENAVDWIR